MTRIIRSDGIGASIVLSRDLVRSQSTISRRRILAKSRQAMRYSISYRNIGSRKPKKRTYRATRRGELPWVLLHCEIKYKRSIMLELPKMNAVLDQFLHSLPIEETSTGRSSKLKQRKLPREWGTIRKKNASWWFGDREWLTSARATVYKCFPTPESSSPKM